LLFEEFIKDKLFKENGNHSNLIDDDKIILGILYNGKENSK